MRLSANPSMDKSLTRPCSPIPRIKRLFSLRIPSLPRPRSESPTPNLPSDVFSEIGRRLLSQADVLSLSLAVCIGLFSTEIL
jgi:hypothetical protein